MKIIKLPTVWDNQNQQLADLGIESNEMKKDPIWVNIDAIAAVNESTEPDQSTLRMNNGEIYPILMPLNELLNLIDV